MGGAVTVFSMPLASTTLNLRWGLSIIALLRMLALFIFSSLGVALLFTAVVAIELNGIGAPSK